MTEIDRMREIERHIETQRKTKGETGREMERER